VMFPWSLDLDVCCLGFSWDLGFEIWDFLSVSIRVHPWLVSFSHDPQPLPFPALVAIVHP